MFNIPTFKVGKADDKSGKSVNLTEAILRDVVASYDPKLHEAPLVIGHPEHNKPAFGWAASVSFNEGQLHVASSDYDQALADLYADGKFKKISGSLYEPDHPNNPAPGHYYLRHVGFLGAMPPAMKGMDNPKLKQAISLADNEAHVLDFTDWNQMDIANTFRRLRDWFIGKYGLTEADKAIPDWPIQNLTIDAAKDTGNGLSFADQPKTPLKGGDLLETPEQLAAKDAAAKKAALEFAEREAKLKTDQDDIAKREAALAKQESDARHKAHVEFCDGLVKAGKLLAADKAGVVVILDGFQPKASVIEFGEGEAKKSATPESIFTDFLKGLPKRVEFGELATDELPGGQDVNPQVIADKAVEFQESEKKLGRIISTAQAVAHVSKKLAA